MSPARPRAPAGVLRRLPAVAWERDARTGRFTYVSEAAEKLLGYPTDEWLAAGFLTARVHPDDRAIAEAYFVKARDSGESCDAEYRIMASNGAYVWVRDIASVTVAQGRPTRIYGVMVDITARRVAEEAQASQFGRLRRQNLALLSLATRDASNGSDLSTSLRALTEADAHALAVERVGVWWLYPGSLKCLDLYCASQNTHRSGMELAVDDYPRYFDAIRAERALCADDALHDPRLSELADSFLREYGITSMLDAPVRVGGRVVAIVCHEHIGEVRTWTADEQQFAASVADLIALAVEARDRRRAEAALRASEARTEAVVNASLDAMVVLDRDGRVIECNRTAELMFGKDRASLVGRPLAEVAVADADRERIRAAIDACHQRGPSLSDERFEIRVRSGDQAFPAEVRAFAFPEDNGECLLAAFIRDLSRTEGMGQALRGEHARLEELMRAREAPLRAALRELESYSFTLAHELRGPVRAIDAFSQVLAEQCAEQLGDGGARYLTRIRAAATRMGELVRDITLLSRITSVGMEREPVDLGTLAAQIAAELQEQEPERNVVFEIQTGAEASCDPGLARILLENLLRNAWKFTSRHTSAHIRFTCEGSGATRVFCVQDDGAGFDPIGTARLFEPFHRLHGTREFDGTGIGLAVVKRIVERHGGRVWAEGAVEKGATFCFTLPDEDR